MTDNGQKTAVKHGYDELSAAYDREGGSLRWSDLRADLVADLPADARLLDAGCGTGKPVLTGLDDLELVDLDDLELVGLDVSRSQLGLARGRVERPLVQGDMTRLPFRAAAFDAVTAFHSVIHVPIEEHAACYREFARVLRPGGQLVVTVGEDAWVGENDDWLDTGVRMAWSFPDLEESREFLREAGFEVVAEYAVHAEMDDYAWPFLRCRKKG